MANNVKKVWASGKAVVNAWLAIPSGFSAEVIAQCGFDSVTVDMQHGVQDYLSMVQCFQAMNGHPVTPMVRVPWNEPGIIGKVLDGGAYGVICPMVNTREDAQKLVAYTRYPPRGVRSYGPLRAMLYGGADYLEHANDTIVVSAMIETAQALENLDSILSVEGLDAIYVGPSDLSLAFGCKPAFEDVEPPVAQAIQHIVDRAKAHRVVPGIHTSGAEGALMRIGMGFQFVTLSSDARILAAASQAQVAKVRGVKAAAGSKSY